MPSAQVTAFLDPRVRGLCAQPYEGHPHGCPNFGKKEGCPPSAPMLPDAYDLRRWRPTYVIWNLFPFDAHVERMRLAHPKWSRRQLECCLYWQGTARKQLEAEIRKFQAEHPDLLVTRCPEAMGLNVTETMRSVGLELEWPPKHWAVQVAFAGTRRGSKL